MKDIDVILDIFDLEKKSDVEKYCKGITITSEALADCIFSGRIGNLKPYNYQSAFLNITPEHLELNDDDLRAMAGAKIGPVEGEVKTAFNKIGSSFDQRKLLNVHLFYTSAMEHWNMFYFSQRDTTKYNNHWELGPHIHYSSELFVSSPLDEVWKLINQNKPKVPKSVHIKYDYHHNRLKPLNK